MIVGLNGKLYGIDTSSSLMYDKKGSDVEIMYVAQMRMLTWTGGIRRKNKLRNESIWKKLEVNRLTIQLGETFYYGSPCAL